ncbi:MAG: type II toxin-antitoxin system PemK/MazF family toxin [Bacteroidetes bacterium]|nr:type II toxin-antitoxin system PemK/MazF family toxin [Bacteroidota bacterium]
MRQRDIWLADLNPGSGREQRGVRPMVIISGDAMNRNLGICIACPITSTIKKYAGCLVLKKDPQNGLDQDSEVLTFQIRTIAEERLIRKLGEITREQLEIIKTGLSEILTY